jgi:hypothetical protein
MINCTGTGPEALHLTRAIAIGDKALQVAKSPVLGGIDEPTLPHRPVPFPGSAF